ncbi:hypothetical protein CCR94_11775 [Rhodoblastus sphagnicola]|uniref:Amino acid permease/ SLC12A domain-containing protein n=1 Tax=Rhodoblastus sphagnicola TaxID=333368 RepID=A0A2S6N7Y7_9HYPH|nr:APC family permease [Rhodoblastus sphagnicola]MBB4197797.1 amino acid transporter [Rhodoblastus sphagnicola]PPQ30735.1 hypothetical protein CCR94_11775 [Rhodoblastus sphagnicola]
MTSSPIQSHGSLKKNHLSFTDVVAQAIGVVAPTATPALVASLVFANAGNGAWLAYVFATLAILFLSLNINVFAKRSASPGALYAFVGQSLGVFWGSIAGWSLLIAYLFCAGAVLSGAVNYALVLLHLVFGAFDDLTPSLILSLGFVALAWGVAWRSIKLSTRLSLSLESITATAIVAILVGVFIQHGTAFDKPQLALEGVTLNNLQLGLVLAFFSFTGFESASVLGHEAKQPLRVIPRAVIATVLALGVFLVGTTYALVAGFQGAAVPLDKADAPLSFIADSIGLSFLGPVIAVGVIASFFASVLGCINASARIIYALSRQGVLHNRAGDAHEDHSTPHIAIAISALIVLVLFAPLAGLGVKLMDVYGYLGSVSTFGFLASYLLVSLGAPVFLKRRGELKARHVVVSAISVVLVGIPFVGVLYPVPDYPLNLLPYLFVGLLWLGVLYFNYLRHRQPETLARIERDLEASSALSKAQPAE